MPPGTKLEFVPGTEPKTIEPGTNKTTTIKIIYPNGEVKEVPVTYNVTGDVVEQPDPNDPTTKPAVPDNFVKVIVKTTDKATQDVTRLFWVNPEKSCYYSSIRSNRKRSKNQMDQLNTLGSLLDGIKY